MVKNGKKGNSTKTGIEYEKVLDLVSFFRNQKNYELSKMSDFSGTGERSGAYEILYKGKKIAYIFKQNSIYKFLEKEHQVNWRTVFSKRMLPDDSLFLLENKTFYVFEIKNQNTPGSVDEKLQTCDFKKKRWQALMKKINYSVEYIYLLSYWFNKDEYRDTKNYIESVGCKYYFKNVDLETLGLPK